jgi:hypothetical protein
MFSFDQDRLMVYGCEVSHCQFGVYKRLSENPHLIEKRKTGIDPDLTPIRLREEGNPIQPASKSKLKTKIIDSNLLEF